MAFTIACYKSTLNKQPSRSFKLWLCCVALLVAALLATNVAHADNFRIQRLETTQVDNVYFVSAKINYSLSTAAKEALNNGIPLLILQDIEVLTPRWWWWDSKIASLEQGYLLIYHALSESYIIHNLNSGTQDNFISLSRAMDALGVLKSLPLLDAKLLDKNTDYYIRMRTYLDIESLPAPMQPIAYVSSDWQLESDWYEWPLQK